VPTNVFLEAILSAAKKDNEALIGISLTVPITLKKDFEELCNKNGITMASALRSLITMLIEDSKLTESSK